MESFNQTIKNIFHFITLIQDACDQKRLFIENQNKQAYDEFVKEWKKDAFVNLPKRIEVELPKQNEVAVLEEEVEELALVDSLLEKARNIRLKTKTSKKTENFAKMSSQGSQLSNSTFKSSAVESQKQKTPLPRRTEAPNSCSRTVPRSKSASIYAKLKPPTVPRSKSAVVQNPLNKTSNGIEKAARSVSTLKPSHASNGTAGIQNAVVLSRTELSEFKKINSGIGHSKTKSQMSHQSEKGLPHSLNLGVKQSPEFHNCFPTYRKFINDSQSISISKPSFRILNNRLWYPFLSLKCKKYLVDQPKCVCFDTFTESVKLIHQIQETMLWIDLFSLIGRDAAPKLHLLEDNDLNTIRLCSYLDSIYNENLQRTPILDQS